MNRYAVIAMLLTSTVVVEIKRGPYNAATDKKFAAWAPEEGTQEAAAFLHGLEAHLHPDRHWRLQHA